MSVPSKTSDRPANASERAPKCAGAPTWRHAGGDRSRRTGPATADPVRGCGEEATGCAILRRRDPAGTQYDDLECHDLLRVGRAGYRYGFAALNLGLQGVAKTPSPFALYSCQSQVLCLPFWWSGLSKLLDFPGGTAEMA